MNEYAIVSNDMCKLQSEIKTLVFLTYHMRYSLLPSSRSQLSLGIILFDGIPRYLLAPSQTFRGAALIRVFTNSDVTPVVDSAVRPVVSCSAYSANYMTLLHRQPSLQQAFSMTTSACI